MRIRRIAPADARTAAELSTELGYPTCTDEMARRIAEFEADAQHAVFVAETGGEVVGGEVVGGEVVGWVDAGIVRHLTSGRYVEIGGLIVSSAHRGKGVGHRLVDAAEAWAREHGVFTIVVRSNVIRERAHAFYMQQQFERVKTSAVFRKRLPSLPSEDHQLD